MDGELERSGLRASDADRSAVAERLRVAVDEGRLSIGEYDDRLRSVYAASTYAELDLVTADLPAPPTSQLPAVQKQRAVAEREEWFHEWRSWLGGAVIMIAIWGTTSLVSGGLNPFWPAIPLGIWAAILIASALGGSRDTRAS